MSDNIIIDAALNVNEATHALRLAVRILAQVTAESPEEVSTLVPYTLDAVDDHLRWAATTLSTLAQASRAAAQEGEPWTFLGTDESTEASKRLVGFASEYAENL